MPPFLRRKRMRILTNKKIRELNQQLGTIQFACYEYMEDIAALGLVTENIVDASYNINGVKHMDEPRKFARKLSTLLRKEKEQKKNNVGD